MKPGEELNKNMGAMETSISDLQGELSAANEPSRKRFKPGGLLLVVLVAILVGGGSFLVVNRLNVVDENTSAIKESCVVRNQQIELLNQKFGQLVVIFDASLKNRPPDAPPPDEQLLKLYAEFRKPIKTLECNDLTKEMGRDILQGGISQKERR